MNFAWIMNLLFTLAGRIEFWVGKYGMGRGMAGWVLLMSNKAQSRLFQRSPEMRFVSSTMHRPVDVRCPWNWDNFDVKIREKRFILSLFAVDKLGDGMWWERERIQKFVSLGDVKNWRLPPRISAVVMHEGFSWNFVDFQISY